MALASYKPARSLVELSLSPVYHYQYSSIAKVFDRIAADDADRHELQQAIQAMCMPYFDRSSSPGYLLLQTDTTPVCKPHSPTLPGRTYVSVPNNPIAGNKPLSIGYDVSFVNLSDAKSGWSLPFSVQRVGTDQTASECALGQLKDLFAHPGLPFGDEELVVNTLDSKYGNAPYLAPAHEHLQLVNVVRLRAGMRVYECRPRSNTGGAPGVYGDKFYLRLESGYQTYKHPKTKQPYEVFQRSICERAADETCQFDAQTRKGRLLNVTVWRYNDMMIRSKNGHNMKDKPFDLLITQVCDAQTGKLIFDREMYTAICGEEKSTITTQQGFQYYRRRYDIEPSFRFGKQQLMLQKFQTPDVEHFDNWLLILMLTFWLLFAASDEADFNPRKWEQYLPGNKHASKAPRLSIAQTRKAAEALFLTFESTPFIPVKSKKGNGRQKGQTLRPRQRFRVVKKTTQKANSKAKIEQIE